MLRKITNSRSNGDDNNNNQNNKKKNLYNTILKMTIIIVRAGW